MTRSDARTGVMEGGGFYAAHSRPQRGAASFGLPMLERACAEVELPPAGEPIVVADMGAAQDRNELEPLSVAVRALSRRRRAGTPILVVHTDLPSNDFGSLFPSSRATPIPTFAPPRTSTLTSPGDRSTPACSPASI